jgi:hypothetical protein
MIPNNVGASITLDIPVDFGLYLDVVPRADWPTGPYTLRSQEEFNPNEFHDNFFAFDVGNNATVIAVEDLDPFPDFDLNDAVMLMVSGDSIPALPDCSPDSRFDEIWSREFGTELDEGELDVATHSTGVYVSGYTAGSFPGFTNAGDVDAFIAKFDHNGDELWNVQFGTSEGDSASSIAVDDSGIYAIGRGIGIYKFVDKTAILNWKMVRSAGMRSSQMFGLGYSSPFSCPEPFIKNFSRILRYLSASPNVIFGNSF